LNLDIAGIGCELVLVSATAEAALAWIGETVSPVSPRFPSQVAVFKAETPWANRSVETASHFELRPLP
jgi:hypothetical protein